MDIFLAFIIGALLGYYLSKDTAKDIPPEWDGNCAVCHEITEPKDEMQIGQRTNDHEASVITILRGHKDCLLPLAKENLESKGDLRKFNGMQQ